MDLRPIDSRPAQAAGPRSAWHAARAGALALFASAALLAGCGGNDAPIPGSTPTAGAPTTKGAFTRVVSFGDSLSDAGTYSPASSLAGNGSAPFFGGRFTTNRVDAAVWVERLSAKLGLPITPALMGFAGQSVACPAGAMGAVYAQTCTAYGQGGARVTDPNGIGRDGGALTVPVQQQVANHLARFGSFNEHDLVLVLAGNNDGFIQFEAFAAKAAQAQADAAAGRITAEQANAAVFAAQQAALGEMKKAGLELAGYVREQMLGKGARYVAVLLPIDARVTPFGQSVPESARPVLGDLTANFSLWLREGLAGQPVQIIDPNAWMADVIGNPGKYGFTNVTVPTCDAKAIAAITSGRVTGGSSLFCNATIGAPYYGLRTGASADTWLFADGVHPTTAGHAAFANWIAAQLAAFGWI